MSTNQYAFEPLSIADVVQKTETDAVREENGPSYLETIESRSNGSTTVDNVHNAAMLWTGGKDSAMALYEANQNGCHIGCLVTFAPSEPNFLAHPLGFIKMQTQALSLPHYVLPVRRPFEQSYEAGLRGLRDELGVRCIVTGDIAEMSGYPNWIRERSRPIGLNVCTPLWGRDRNTLLRQLLQRGFKVLFSCVKTRWLDESWIGRRLNDSAVAELRAIREQTGLDICGEEGEYHTLVIDGPQFTRGIGIRSYSKRKADSIAYIEIRELELIDRAV